MESALRCANAQPAFEVPGVRTSSSPANATGSGASGARTSSSPAGAANAKLTYSCEPAHQLPAVLPTPAHCTGGSWTRLLQAASCKCKLYKSGHSPENMQGHPSLWQNLIERNSQKGGTSGGTVCKRESRPHTTQAPRNPLERKECSDKCESSQKRAQSRPGSSATQPRFSLPWAGGGQWLSSSAIHPLRILELGFVGTLPARQSSAHLSASSKQSLQGGE